MAVWSVVGISLLAFLCQSGLPPRVLDRFLFEFALVPSRVFGQLRLVAPSDWTPFLTNIVLHGGWLHLILNMWTLWIFGPAVEDRLGPGRFTLGRVVRAMQDDGAPVRGGGSLEPHVRLGKLDTEAEQQIAGRYGIRGTPTMILFRSGKEIARTSGAMPAAQIAQWARSHV